MHELPVTESVLEIALRHAKGAGAERITNIYLVIGQLSSIVDDSIQFYWDIVSKDSLAQGAKLHFRRIPTEIECLDCHHLYQPGRELACCPNCGSCQVKVIKGEEFFLEAIDIEP